MTRLLRVTGQTAQEQSADSFHHTRQSLVSLRHFPTKLVRRTEHARSPTPVAAKMRTKKAGPGSRAAPPASTGQWKPSVGGRLTNESAVMGQQRPGLRIAEQYNVIWPLMTLGPGEATLAGVNTALSLISDNSLGFDHLNATFQRYVIKRDVALSV